MGKVIKGSYEDRILEAYRVTITDVLEEMFGDVPPEILEKIVAEENEQRLRSCRKNVFKLQSIDEFQI